MTNALVGLTVGVSSSNMQTQILFAYLRRDLSSLELSAITTGSVIGSMLGALTLPLLTKLLKKLHLIIAASMGLIASQLFCCIQSTFVILLLLRAFIGYFISLISTLVPNLTQSMVLDKQRSKSAAMFQLFGCVGGVCCGLHLFFLAKGATSWRTMLCFGALLSLLQMLMVARLNKLNNSEQSFAGEAARQYQRSQRHYILAITLGIVQQFTGINVAMSYGSTMLKNQ